MRVCVLGSGSKGNCTYVECGNTGILIDAGLSCAQIETGRYENYRQILAEADNVKDELSILRKRQIDRMQDSETNSQMQVNLLYLNVLQESQQLLSNMRHQLRAAKKFME